MNKAAWRFRRAFGGGALALAVAYGFAFASAAAQSTVQAPGAWRSPRLGAGSGRAPARSSLRVSPVEGAAPLTVHAEGRRAGPPYSEVMMRTEWDFGDGTRIPGTNEFSAEHTYTKPGLYAVRFCPVRLSSHPGRTQGCAAGGAPVATVTVRAAQK